MNRGMLPFPRGETLTWRVGGFARGINLNSANTDTPITILSPTPLYRVQQIQIRNTGPLASLTTVTAGLFGAPGASGISLAALQALSAVVSNLPNVANNALALATAQAYLNLGTLYFRVGTAQGAPASVDVHISIIPLP